MSRVAITYSADELAFVYANRDLPRAALHAAFVRAFRRDDVVVEHLKALCVRKGWRRRARFSPAEDDILRAFFPHRPTVEVAAMIGRSCGATHQRALKLGIRKSAEYLASDMSGRIKKGERRGTATEFRKGMTPANKGLRRPGWAPGRMKETQFGNKPVWNHQPIGATRIDSEGYEWTKVQDLPKVRTDVNWRPTHTLRWEAVHGPVPTGHVLKCLDGDRLNTDPANWRCVPKSLMPLLNGGRMKKRIAFDAAPVELKPTVMAVAQLEHALGRRKRRTQDSA